MDRALLDVDDRLTTIAACSLWALLPAEHGQAVHKTLDAHARSSAATSTPGDHRALDERRIDAMVGLITGSAGDTVGTSTSTSADVEATDATTGSGASAGDEPARPDAPARHTAPTLHGQARQIHVTVSWSTLIGHDDAPADLTGYGPIDATTARRIASEPNSVWRRLLVDPPSGRLLDYGRNTYTPPQDLQDFVIARGSRRLSDFTHLVPIQRYRLHRCCSHVDRHTLTDRSHHRLEHEAGWTHHRDPDTDDSIWTDPTGNHHIEPATKLPTPHPVEPPTPPATRSDDDLGDHRSEGYRRADQNRPDAENPFASRGCALHGGAVVDPQQFLAAYDEQLRTDAETPSAISVERYGPLRLVTFAGGRGFVTYRDLDGADADAIARLVATTLDHYRGDATITRVEWKSRGHDHAPGLHDVLLEQGFVAEETESIMIGEATRLAADVPLPDGVTLRQVVTEADVRAMSAMQDEVFGDPLSREMADALLHRLALDDGMQLWVAEHDGEILTAGRLEPVADTAFAGIWGGATREAWRGRGIYRALTAARARAALAMGKTLIHSDSTAFSRPILERSGLVAVSTTTPYLWRR